MQDASESHPIAGVFTPRLVARLQRDAFDGALRFHSGNATRVVYFRRGDIASAASNAESDRLHNILIGEGRLTGPQVDMARSKLKPGATLGKTLIDLGFLTPSELLSGARRQVRQILASCFALTDGVYQVAPGPVGPEVTNLGLPVRRLIFDALMESGDRRTIVGEIGSMESVYAPTPALGEALAVLRLETPAEEVARRLDGRATLREISGRTHLDDFTVSKIVLALEIMGLAEVLSRPEEEQRAATVAARPEGRVIPIETDAGPAAPPRPEAARPAPALVVVSAAGSPAAVEAEPAVAGATEAVPFAAAAASPAPFPSSDDEPLGPGRYPGSPGRGATREPDGDDDSEAADRGARAPAEPPPFADDELPAFAVPERGAREDDWHVDPETGERVREGPVELTFDGPVVPRVERSSTGSRWLGIGIVVAVVMIAGYLAIRLRQPSPGTSVAANQATPTPGPGETTTTPGQAAEPAAEPAPEPPARQAQEQAPETAAPPRDATAPSPAAGTPQTESPPPAATTRAQAAPPAPAPEEDDFGSGQARLDSGDVAGAATLFSRMVAAAPASDLTLQVAIACDPENITKARRATRPDGPLFVVPFRLQERSCWRLCWGRYGDREAAHAAAAALPPYFTSAGVTPVVVSFGRLRPPG